MISKEIRSAFLNFFKKNQHTVVPSSPVVPLNDPTLLFVNAGMNQFKDVFLGKSTRDYTKAASSQKCIRVGGKHNDLENVGHTTRHLTFFEMLGNFSFGDYFKKEAIQFAWEVTTNLFQFDPQFLYATVFYEDEESFELWKAYLPENKIVRMGEKDNFWAMGDIGPCGPCTELLYDRGPGFGSATHPVEDVNGERFFEFWNLVFMQFNRESNGKFLSLPKLSVDTGAGLERVVSLKMGVNSLFETDIIMGLIHEIERISRKKYDPKIETAPSFRVIADHLRALAFACGDGAQPSNIERGYVLRKILRRAVRYGRQLGLEDPFLAKLLPTLVSFMGEDYPELKLTLAQTSEILTREEESFLRTLKRGGNILNQIIDQSKVNRNQISGEDAFKLKDTYGLPLEEIQLLGKDAGLNVDLEGFEKLEKEARDRSKATRKVKAEGVSETLFTAFLEQEKPSTFLGYTELHGHGKVIGLMKEGVFVDELKEGDEGAILVDQTPFYAEKGGQVGDSGIIQSERSSFEVSDTKTPFPGIILHLGVVKEGSFGLKEEVSLEVHSHRRQKIANNHTATHLLHFALEQVLGSHIKQAGSVVEAGRLRFDFNHHKPLTFEEIYEIEGIVNQKIRENIRVGSYEIPFEEALTKKEIKQFFGEKYGKSVRVVEIADSKELCGGTHTSFSGNIGSFKITKETSIASGVRRIEAITGEEVEAHIREMEKQLSKISETLKVQPAQVLEKIESVLESLRASQEAAEKGREKEIENQAVKLLQSVENKSGISFLVAKVDLNSKELKVFSDKIFEKQKTLALFLISETTGKSILFVRVSPDLVSKGIHANTWLEKVAPIVKGKGGGKADFATGGGSTENIENALKHAREWILSV